MQQSCARKMNVVALLFSHLAISFSFFVFSFFSLAAFTLFSLIIFSHSFWIIPLFFLYSVSIISRLALCDVPSPISSISLFVWPETIDFRLRRGYYFFYMWTLDILMVFTGYYRVQIENVLWLTYYKSPPKKIYILTNTTLYYVSYIAAVTAF